MSSQQKPKLHQDWIDSHALKIVRNLKEAGFQTYLVGGCVRDLLVGIHPKDYDIATSAHPNQVRKKIPNAYVIGRRFKLVLVKKGDQQFEVATFRRNVSAEEATALGDEAVDGDNYFGTIEEDAQRRDFTANALFYDPVEQNIIDHCGGMKDIQERILRIIGDPVERLKEDPIRILRAIRLSHKLHFSIESSLRSAISECAPDLKRSVLPRRREEWLKFLRLPEPHIAFMELFDLRIMEQILPSLHAVFTDSAKMETFEIHLARIGTAGINQSDPIELFAAFMLAYLRAEYGEWTIEILDSKELTDFMKDELGIFKLEASIFFKALQVLQGLHKVETYLRKGERRQQAFIHNEAFTLALKLAHMDYALSPHHMYFWQKEVDKYQAHPVPYS